MTKRGTLISLGLILLLALPLTAFARGQNKQAAGLKVKHPIRHYGRRHGHPPCLWKDARLIEKLQLTDDQVSALKQADFEFRERAIELKGELEKAQLQFERAMSKIPVDEKAVKKAAGNQADAQSRMFMLHVEHQLSVRKILTEDQLKELDKLPDNRNIKRKRRHRRYQNNFDQGANPEEG